MLKILAAGALLVAVELAFLLSVGHPLADFDFGSGLVRVP